MEINLAGAIIAILLVTVVAVFGCMIIFGILQSLGLMRFKKTAHFIWWSIGLGIAIVIIVWEIRKPRDNNNVIQPGTIQVMTDTSVSHEIKDTTHHR